MRKKIILIAGFAVIIGLMSCQKNDNINGPSLATTLSTTVAEITGTQITSVTSADEHSVSVESFNGTTPAVVLGHFNAGDFGIPGYGISGIGHFKFGIPHIDSCATVTVSSSSFPREIVIEYAGDCADHGRHVRKGKVIIDISDTLTNAGASETIKYEDFYIDSMKVELNATLKNLGQNSSGNWVMEKIYKQTITKGNDVCVRENNESAEWISGFGTTSRSDDKYYLTGSGKVTLNDTTYTKTITTPLLFDGSCEYRITSGIVQLTKNSSSATIDYGDGTCDNKATVTIDGNTEEISLHSHDFKGGGMFGRHCRGFGRKG